jgi:membrane protein implicated in regulation of membrane protease activity
MWWQDPWVIVAFAVGFAAVVAAIIWTFQKTQASTNVDTGGLVGQRATVVTPIPQGGAGEIAFVAGGTRQNASARSADGEAIPSMTEVEIMQAVGNAFIVQTVKERAVPANSDQPDANGGRPNEG